MSPAAPVATLRTAVVGTGLIGGSILRRLHEAGIGVIAWDPDPETRRAGVERGLVFAEQLTDAVRDSDVIFLAGPLVSLPSTLVEVAATSPPEAVITDVGSTKTQVAAVAAERGLVHRFVPGHPMAGAERAGLGAADPALFDGAAWALCPSSGTGLRHVRTLVQLIITVFRARIVPMSPRVHDLVAALSSHIPHVLAGTLAGAVARSPLREAVLGLAAGSFRDGTRVAGTPSRRTADMLISNREAVLRQLEPVQEFLAGLVAALRDNDVDALVGHYTQSRTLREQLLDRPTREVEQRFPLTGPAGDELAFLLELGESGGFITGCTVHDGKVSYAAHRPG